MFEIFRLNSQLEKKLAVNDISDSPWAQPLARTEKVYNNIRAKFDSSEKIEELTNDIKETENKKEQTYTVSSKLSARYMQTRMGSGI